MNLKLWEAQLLRERAACIKGNAVRLMPDRVYDEYIEGDEWVSDLGDGDAGMLFLFIAEALES